MGYWERWHPSSDWYMHKFTGSFTTWTFPLFSKLENFYYVPFFFFFFGYAPISFLCFFIFFLILLYKEYGRKSDILMTSSNSHKLDRLFITYVFLYPDQYISCITMQAHLCQWYNTVQHSDMSLPRICINYNMAISMLDCGLQGLCDLLLWPRG